MIHLHVLSSRFGKHPDSWQHFAAAISTIFGLLLLLNVHPIGDGVWYWYARAMRDGKSLYRDLHVSMQPLFFLGTELNQRMFGNGWLASKLLAVGQVFAYCGGLVLVTRRLPGSDRLRAILLAAVFGMTVMASYSRFDDFHITGHCLVLFSIYLLLRIRDQTDRRSAMKYALLLGLLSGLGIANRLNDGGFLFLSVIAGLLCFVRAPIRRTLFVFCAAAAFAVSTCILLTGRSFRDWAQYTIFRAVSIKGGTSHMVTAPFHFPYAIEVDLFADPHLIRDFCYLLILLGVLAYALYFRQLKSVRNKSLVTGLCSLIAFPLSLIFLQQALSGSSILAATEGCTIALYALVITLVLRFIHLLLIGRVIDWNRNEIFVLIPFGQTFSGAMTSGESLLEAYAPLAFLLLVLPLVLPSILRIPWQKVFFTVLLALLASGSMLAKVTRPYFWQRYTDRAVFVNRTWYHHPDFGLMYIEKPQLALLQSMCSVIHQSPHPELLAMPWPYPNYFCNLPPWHGYIQTWYDTTTRQTIQTLMSELQANPPEWIAYQRSFDMISTNESAFNHGEKLPQRDMDKFIAMQLRNGKWSLPWQRCFGGTDWLVIHTRPAQPGEPNDVLLPSSDRVNLCSRTSYILE